MSRPVHRLGGCAARAAIPGLLASYQDKVPQPAARWMHLSVRPQFFAILRTAPDDVDPDLDFDEVFDLVEGAILGRILVPAIAHRASGIDSIVDIVLRILTPRRASVPRSSPRRSHQ